MLSPPPNRPAAPVRQGVAELTLALRGGRTRLARSSTRPPLQVQGALHPERTLPAMALVLLSNPTGGIFQGDDHQISVTAETGAAAHVSTQGATRVHAMPLGQAKQCVSLEVAPGGYLEYLPDPLIPYQDSDFQQRTTIAVKPGGILVSWEVLTPGRLAMGEAFQYRRLASHLEVLGEDRVPQYIDSFEIIPSRRNPLLEHVAGPMVPERRAYTLGSMLIIAEGRDLRQLQRELQETTADSNGVPAGVTCLPGKGALGIRALGRDCDEVQKILRRCWAKARLHLLGVGIPDPRKY
ncbi:MAG: urease accessory protein UreD [Chloroflexota bacterium]|nr:urease accessory protein UreD [Chloroflexota bacterium]